MPSDQQYGSSIRRETSFFANWAPNAPRQIGDFGPVEGALFQYHDRLEPAEIQALGRREGPSAAGYDIMIQSTRSIGSRVAAQVGAAVADGKALLEFKFSSDQGVAFVAPSVRISEIESLTELGRILRDRLKQKRWDNQHAVVVQVSVAESATILLSNQAGAEMKFEIAADVPVDAQLVAKLDAGASLVSSKGVGLKIIGEGPLTPLFKLASLKRRIFGDPNLVYRHVPGEDLNVLDVDDEYVLVVS